LLEVPVSKPYQAAIEHANPNLARPVLGERGRTICELVARGKSVRFIKALETASARIPAVEAVAGRRSDTRPDSAARVLEDAEDVACGEADLRPLQDRSRFEPASVAEKSFAGCQPPVSGPGVDDYVRPGPAPGCSEWQLRPDRVSVPPGAARCWDEPPSSRRCNGSGTTSSRSSGHSTFEKPWRSFAAKYRSSM